MFLVLLHSRLKKVFHVNNNSHLKKIFKVLFQLGFGFHSLHLQDISQPTKDHEDNSKQSWQSDTGQAEKRFRFVETPPGCHLSVHPSCLKMSNFRFTKISENISNPHLNHLRSRYLKYKIRPNLDHHINPILFQDVWLKSTEKLNSSKWESSSCCIDG